MNADWDHLKIALAISRTGSMTAAALQLGMDQTTVGRRLTALEEQLDTTLFLRSKSGFVATEAGQMVISRAHRIEAQISAMQDDLAESQHSVMGLMRIMGNTWMLQLLAENILPPLLSANPRLELRLSGRLPPAPIHGEPTLSLWFDAAPTHPDKAIPLCRVPYAAYRSKTSEVKTGWVQFQDDLAQGPSFSRQIRRRMDAEAQIHMTATDAQILQGAVRSGLGQAMLPRALGDNDPQLTRLTDADTDIDRVLHLHVGPEAYRTKRVQLVITSLHEQIADLLAGKLLLKSPVLKL